MRIAIVVLNFNGKERTLQLLGSVKSLNLENIELQTIVVDNGSTDDSSNEIKNLFPDVTLLVNHENLGYAEGNNVGVRYALKKETDYILLLNNDTSVDRELLLNLLKAADLNPKGGIFGPKIYFSKGFETHKNRYTTEQLGKVLWYAGGIIDWRNVLGSHRGVDEVDHGQYDQIQKTDFVSGCSMFVSRKVFERVGLFDKRYYLYYEDVDFCQRALRYGFELYYVPHGRVWHDNAKTAGGTGSELQSYYITRNRILMGMRYAPWRTKLALFREALNLLMHGTKTQKQAVGDYLRRHYGKRGA